MVVAAKELSCETSHGYVVSIIYLIIFSDSLVYVKICLGCEFYWGEYCTIFGSLRRCLAFIKVRSNKDFYSSTNNHNM